MDQVEHIRTATLRMKVCRFKDGLSLRMAVDSHSTGDELVRMEALSRERAYKNTRLLTGSAFFDDSDMHSEYYLVLVYDEKNKAPLLTARYYSDVDTIRKCLLGDGLGHTLINIPKKIMANNIFLADRLSANPASSLYRKYRNYIYKMFYSEIFKRTSGSSYVIMARKEQGDKLLNKYLALGSHIGGTVMHKGCEHWVLYGDVNESYAFLRKDTAKHSNTQ